MWINGGVLFREGKSGIAEGSVMGHKAFRVLVLFEIHLAPAGDAFSKRGGPRTSNCCV